MSVVRDGYQRLRASLRSAIGDVTFGMEDGAVSIAGLVFGVSASTNDASIVVLAGSTGAVAGAVSMMAGRYLDAQSVGQRTITASNSIRARIAADPQEYLDRVATRLRASGLTSDETAVLIAAFIRNPKALADHVIAYEGRSSDPIDAAPLTHALWMFFSVLVAGSIPVIPFVLFDIDTARIVSLIITGIMMALLGIARGKIGGVSLWKTAAQTMAIAGAAAIIGVVIGRLVT
jgi:VIT1/CCC1 family predicted Fe2+/Mn2+ transporter